MSSLRSDPNEDEAPADPAFEALLVFLREAREFDFSGYKRASLVRRVRRRMQTVDIDDFDSYVDYLQVHPDEFNALFNTILINVTRFFRDADAWNFLCEEVLPSLVTQRPAGPIRVWSAGCATGEEAYSLAMCMVETLGEDVVRELVKIYATDIDAEALDLARVGGYSEHQLGDVSVERRTRFFETAGDRYVFRKDLRRSVIFGRNDLLQDAPISHLDLLVCRNTLMYFTPEAQNGIVRRLHFALNDHGVLFIGKAEMLLSQGALFTPVEASRRFFHKVSSSKVRDSPGLTRPARAGDEIMLGRVMHEALLSAPAAQIVVTHNRRLAMSNHRANELFGLSRRQVGRPLQDLEVSYRPLELRAHLDTALAARQPIWIRDVIWARSNGREHALDVQVVPLADERGSPLGVTVIFNDVTAQRDMHAELDVANRHLEHVSEELQSTNEELETTNEELQSTVEELETTNEELQSTNEELETMNEELQAMNDELHSSNHELRMRTEEITELNHFMESVLASFQAGIVVVDPELTVSAWNRTAEELWGVRQDEAVGQHLLSLDIGLPFDELKSALRATLADGSSEHHRLELDAVNRRGRPIRVRVTVSPLRRVASDYVGAIVTMDTSDLPSPTR